MPALDAPPPPDEPRDPAIERWNARLGLILFAAYGGIYAGFVGVSAFAPGLLAVRVGPLNVALAYGFAPILGAMLLAAVYLAFARTPRTGRPA